MELAALAALVTALGIAIAFIIYGAIVLISGLFHDGGPDDG